MRLHAHAGLGPRGRLVMVERVIAGGTVKDAACSAGVSPQTCPKWLARYRAEGPGGLDDRSSVARRIPRRTSPGRVEAIWALRRLRFTGAQIAEIRVTGMRHHTPTYTDRAGVRRKRSGWECVHGAIDDASRLASAEVLEDETAASAVGLLQRALAFYERHGIQVEAVMTDNGSPYVSAAHAPACRSRGLRHLRTRADRPRTNGKACVSAWLPPPDGVARLTCTLAA